MPPLPEGACNVRIKSTGNGGWGCHRGRVDHCGDRDVDGGGTVMNDGFYWDGLTRRSLFTCYSHGRYIDSATGLCPTCQREAKQQAETRANNEAVRRIAVEAEAAVMAEMYQL